MADKLFVTREGLEKLKKELTELVEIKRPEVAQKIKEAREMGDISENSAYDSARLEQSNIEGRITELEEVIKHAKISEIKSKDKVFVGSKVTLHIDGEELVYEIVGAPEADPALMKISHESPIGSALLGKAVGDKIFVEVPVGKVTYTIKKIE